MISAILLRRVVSSCAGRWLFYPEQRGSMLNWGLSFFVIPPGTHPIATDFEIGSLKIGPSPWAPEVNFPNFVNRNQEYLLQEPLDGYWSFLLFDRQSLRSAVAVKRRRGPRHHWGRSDCAVASNIPTPLNHENEIIWYALIADCWQHYYLCSVLLHPKFCCKTDGTGLKLDGNYCSGILIFIKQCMVDAMNSCRLIRDEGSMWQVSTHSWICFLVQSGGEKCSRSSEDTFMNSTAGMLRYDYAAVQLSIVVANTRM